ncbi:histidine--tRNA ligase [uncultured Winogradskyella sp.]|uniref:histidine--tRNA ligase n=1 Tax=uncultured Winogradskyella sp. TaxID=395353 RepID=UPI00260B73C3|nr:histidine--tRNA ligase [uncultured Winogradskyella sp.]
MAQKPSIPKGTRDFNAEAVAKRSYIIETTKEQFQLYGFQPIETPSFENSETLMGKYGDEGDRLIFKILNSGNFLFEKNTIELPESLNTLMLKSLDELSISEKIELNKFTDGISGKALRYDLTVPFARYVVQHQNDIVFPFKRYQIQPVWRADRPQKGRFREFYQCDADVVGSKSLFQEVEFVQLYDAVFNALKLDGVTIKINNRKILSGIAEVIGAQDKLIDFTVALDKLDKIGEEKVKEEMRSKGISEEGISKLQPLFSLKGDFGNQVKSLKSILSVSEIGLEGIKELEFINTAISNLKLKTATLQLDVTLARGLNYYTGAIFEVSAPEGVKMGSIGGGGRYDDLTSIFGKPDTSGVGISFGLDRIYLVLEELGLFPNTITDATKVLFINFGEKEALACLEAVTQLRQKGIKAELYPDAAKMKKQMTYANRRNIPYVVLVGKEELESKMFTLKTMETGTQEKLKLQDLLQALL